MKVEELLGKLIDMGKADTGMTIEFPSPCGRSNIGTKRCPEHGHLSLAVSLETVQDFAFADRAIAILILVPKTEWELNISPFLKK